MPAEPFGLLLRPRNFFLKNPALDVRPSYSSTPSQVKAEWEGVLDRSDEKSTLAFGKDGGCCENGATTSAKGALGPWVHK